MGGDTGEDEMQGDAAVVVDPTVQSQATGDKLVPVTNNTCTMPATNVQCTCKVPQDCVLMRAILRENMQRLAEEKTLLLAEIQSLRAQAHAQSPEPPLERSQSFVQQYDVSLVLADRSGDDGDETRDSNALDEESREFLKQKERRETCLRELDRLIRERAREIKRDDVEKEDGGSGLGITVIVHDSKHDLVVKEIGSTSSSDPGASVDTGDRAVSVAAVPFVANVMVTKTINGAFQVFFGQDIGRIINGSARPEYVTEVDSFGWGRYRYNFWFVGGQPKGDVYIVRPGLNTIERLVHIVIKDGAANNFDGMTVDTIDDTIGDDAVQRNGSSCVRKKMEYHVYFPEHHKDGLVIQKNQLDGTIMVFFKTVRDALRRSGHVFGSSRPPPLLDSPSSSSQRRGGTEELGEKNVLILGRRHWISDDTGAAHVWLRKEWV